MKKYFETIKRCPLFDGIAEENLLPMLGCLGAKAVAFDKNEAIISEGDPAKHIGIVLSGKARIERIDFYGNRSIVTTVGHAELFGESFACAQTEKFPFDIIASEKAEILLIDCRKITVTCCNACEFHNRMIFNLLKVVAAKNIVLNRKAEITSKRTTREKLMTYLLSQAKENGSRGFYIPYDRQGLADFLEVERSGLSSEIGKLRNEGILESKRNYFKLL